MEHAYDAASQGRQPRSPRGSHETLDRSSEIDNCSASGKQQPCSTKADFEFIGLLGCGTFGVVHRAVRKQDGREYAIKQLSLRSMSRAEQFDSVKEVQVLAALDSPQCVRYFDSFLDAPSCQLYIVMECATGGSLHDYIQAHKATALPEEFIWRVLLQLALGLHHMHSRNVLHRDIKAMNIFLDGQLNVKIGDVGVAKVLRSSSSLARTMVGTPYYLSPEVCASRPYDARSDIWALGVVMYECCQRQHPFDANSQSSLVLKILRGQYKPITGYSQALADVIRLCLTQSTARRPTAAALLALPAVRAKAAELGLELPAPPAKPAPPTAWGPSDATRRASRPPKPPLPAAPVPPPRGAVVSRASPRPAVAGKPAAAPAARRSSCPGGLIGAPAKGPPKQPPPAPRERFTPMLQQGASREALAPSSRRRTASDAASGPALRDSPRTPQRHSETAERSQHKAPASPPQSVFSVQQPLAALSAAAQEWLSQRGAVAGARAGSAATAAPAAEPPLLEGGGSPDVSRRRSAPSLQLKFVAGHSVGPMLAREPSSGKDKVDAKRSSCAVFSLVADCSAGAMPQGPPFAELGDSAMRRQEEVLQPERQQARSSDTPAEPRPSVSSMQEESLTPPAPPAVGLREQAEAQRCRCRQLLGAALFEELYGLLSCGGEQEGAGDGGSMSLAQLGDELFRRAGVDNAEGIHSLFRLCYLEGQLC